LQRTPKRVITQGNHRASVGFSTKYIYYIKTVTFSGSINNADMYSEQ